MFKHHCLRRENSKYQSCKVVEMDVTGFVSRQKVFHKVLESVDGLEGETSLPFCPLKSRTRLPAQHPSVDGREGS